MKYFIVIVCFVAVALAQPAPGCTILDRPNVRLSDCCKGIELIDKTKFEMCQKMYPIEGNTDGIDRLTQRGNVLECYLNQTGLLKNGEIDNDGALVQFIRISDSPLRPLIRTAVETCREKGTANGEESDAVGIRGRIRSVIQGFLQTRREEGGPASRLKAIAFFRCVELNVYEGCPVDNKITSDECTQLTNFYEKCKNNFQ